MVRFIRPSSSNNGSLISIKLIIIYTVLSISWFFIGSFINASSSSSFEVEVEKIAFLEKQIREINMSHRQEQKKSADEYRDQIVKMELMELEMKNQIDELEKIQTARAEVEAESEETSVDYEIKKANKSHENASGSGSAQASTSSKNIPRFAINAFSGMATTSKKEFSELYDYGSPVDDKAGNGVTLLYNTHSMPKGLSKKQESNILYGNNVIQNLSATQATNQCRQMDVVTIASRNARKKSCVAIVQNYDNYSVQKWMRKDNDLSKELVAGSRAQTEERRRYIAPSKNAIHKHWKLLQTYFNSVDTVLKELKPIAEKVAKDNTIIIMTCNMGQSDMLMNYMCNAKAKGLDLSNILVFPTDQDTKELAEGLGLTTFYDEKNFGQLPKGEAKDYGDEAFVSMMYAKVVSVQLISFLGYDLLFQDVDVVWYKNPLTYFHDASNPHNDFDMYFQDDGARSTRYGPYSANSGFYYVRNNEKTRYLLTSLLYAGDLIIQSQSHQEALIMLLNDHASSFGLRVKVLNRDMEEFPCGWHYHLPNKDFMKKLVTKKSTPFIFHMSWTDNKTNKKKFYQQMGEWYVSDQCADKTETEILGISDKTEKEILSHHCCLAEPNIVCHYRDKPSKIPCKDSPPFDEGGRSFW